LVAHGEGLVVPSWRPQGWGYRRRVRWDQVLGVELVDGWGLNRGRKIRIHTEHAWIDARAPRDGFFARDPRLDEIVELLWRQVPPRGPALPAT
jgi:hypothetical protein